MTWALKLAQHEFQDAYPNKHRAIGLGGANESLSSSEKPTKRSAGG